MASDSVKNQITEFPSGILSTCTSYGLYINRKVSVKTNVPSRNIAFSRKHYHATYISGKSNSIEKSIFHERRICFDYNFGSNIQVIRPSTKADFSLNSLS